MGSGFDAPTMCPSNGSVTRRSLPSPGSAGNVPRVLRYYEALRFPASLSATLRFLRMTVTIPARLCSCLQPSPTPTWGQGVWGWHFPEPVDVEMETAGRPKFLGNPDVPAPCSQTPARPTCQAIAAGRRGPTYQERRGLSTKSNFGARSHGIGTRYLLFNRWVAPPVASCKTRFWLLASSTRRD